MNDVRFSLVPDHRGMIWDLLLYVPTVFALVLLASKFWFGGDTNLAYLLSFLASFFFIAGANRILKTRLMLLPTAPTAIEVGKQTARLILRNGDQINLVKDLRFYSDFAGRSFGLAGLDGTGERLQFVFHKGQFPDERAYKSVLDALRSTS